MSGAQVADGFDRLPWLADERPAPATGRSELLPWAIAGVLLIAATSYWVGRTSFDQPFPQSATLQVPAARSAEAASAPDAESVAQSGPIQSPTERRWRSHPTHRLVRPARTPAAHERPALPSPAARPAPLPLWPARVVDGAAGRLVRVGVFISPRQAKQGWWGIVRMNPALQRLPAVVVPVRSLPDGRVYYRLQMGTTSQAHSEVLCQRMRMVAVSCVVVGLDNRTGKAAAA